MIRTELMSSKITFFKKIFSNLYNWYSASETASLGARFTPFP